MNAVEELAKIVTDSEYRLKTSISMLEQLIVLTEEKYAYVYETLPKSEEEINISIQEVEILLEYIIYNDKSQSELARHSVVVDALVEIKQEFEEVTETFLNQELISGLTRTFLDETGQSERGFSELSRVTANVKDTLESLRDLALNSIIFAIRAGTQGAGFQVISNKINQISSLLTQQFAVMNANINELNQWNQDFQKKLLDFIKYEENLKTQYQEKFNNEFAKVQDILKVTCQIFNNHLSNTKTVFARVPEAMVLIQNQDIIRQNIENLVKCLNILLTKKEILLKPDRDEVLDYLVFSTKAGELAEVLLDNIKSGLANSILAIEQVLKDINMQADSLETEGEYLSRFFAGLGALKPEAFSVLNEVFHTIIGQVVDLMYIRNHIETKSNALKEGRKKFILLMEDVERDLEAINREIRTLKKIKVLLKIELTRIDLDNDHSMANITGAVEQVIDTVYENQAHFLRLRDYFVKNIDVFNQAIEMTGVKLKKSTKTLLQAKEKLGQAEFLTIGAIQAMRQEMGEIFAELKKPYIHLQVMEQVNTILNEVRQMVGAHREMMKQRVEEFFEFYGVDHWEEEQADLKALLDQFTCQVERKAADVIFDDWFTESDNQSSAIVLF